MNLKYILPRLVRHFLPSKAVRSLLRHGWIIRPGLETASPIQAVDRYQNALSDGGFSLSGKRVMVFGYGGNFAIACGLIEAGAGHVTLSDKYAPPDETANRALLPQYSRYLSVAGEQVQPRPEFIVLLDGDIRDIAASRPVLPFDIILSNSVFEHLDDVQGTTQALAKLTAPGGCQLHFIDLRDHYFRYPFEMLTFSQDVWLKWLNPGSNLNRYRLKDYEQVFEQYFGVIDLTILRQDREAFEQARGRIRPEFLSGEPDIDSATLIHLLASNPI